MVINNGKLIPEENLSAKIKETIQENVVIDINKKVINEKLIKLFMEAKR